MNPYSPIGPWQRTALALAASITGITVLASTALLFSDDQDRRWIAVSMGLATPAPACGGAAASTPACGGAQPPRVAQAAPVVASGANYALRIDPTAP